MLLKNNSARLVTVNHDGEAFQILPGNNPAVSLPIEACQSDFVQCLVANGELTATAEDKDADVESTDVEIADMTKSQLLALCEQQEIETNSRDTVATLITKLEEA